MNDDKAKLLQRVILEATDAAVEVDVDNSGLRRGLRAHFRGWTRQEGPVFGLMPSGLSRHIVDLQFGNYSRPCVKHITETATAEQYAVARALVSQLASEFEVNLSPAHDLNSWEVSPDLRIKATIKGIDSQHDDDAVARSAEEGMVPLIAAIAELIGCEDTDAELGGDREGDIIEATTIRRERSRRNRLLCLSIHGEICGVCGLDPVLVYGPDYGKILEVHHIEPLSESREPRAYDPALDLIPLCPNCHRAIHRPIPAFTPEELKSHLLTT